LHFWFGLLEKLLDLLAVTLSGEKFKPPGQPVNWKAASNVTDLSVSHQKNLDDRLRK
jgi:hypothetical protein